jgi:hypothetical protein
LPRGVDTIGDVPRRGPDLVVVSPLKDWTCAGCGSAAGGWLTMDDRGPLCMSCADLEHLCSCRGGIRR